MNRTFRTRLLCLALFIAIYILLYPLIFRLNPIITDDTEISITMGQVMSGQPLAAQWNQDDKRVIDYVFNQGLLVPPSKLPYNLTSPNQDTAKGPGLVIRSLLPLLNISKGFYVECGAYDGEYISNTLYLERTLGWKGLLVEGSPLNYEMLKSKNRKAWLSKTCLSIHPYPHRSRFLVKHVLGKVLEPDSETEANDKEVEIQCVPLFTLLSAIKVDTVDFFSLDVEGSEFQVLKTIPFNKVFIKVISVENSHSEFNSQLIEFMKTKDYSRIGGENYTRFLREDYVFVHEKFIQLALMNGIDIIK